MALDLGGRHDRAERAYEWLRAGKRAGRRGTRTTSASDVKDPTLDTNVTAYIAERRGTSRT